MKPRYFLPQGLIGLWPLLFAATCQKTTPQAATFATLQAAGAAIDSYRASYEAAFAQGKIDVAAKQRCDVQFNVANEAIIAAAKAARDGFNATTPAEVNQAVNSFIKLVVLLVPPKP
jgi:hypothetical protein